MFRPALVLLCLPACKGVQTWTAAARQQGPALSLSGHTEVAFMALAEGGMKLESSEALGHFDVDLTLSRLSGDGTLHIELDYYSWDEFYAVEHRREAGVTSVNADGKVLLERPAFDWDCRALFCQAKGVLLFDTPADSSWQASWQVDAAVTATSADKEFEAGEGTMDILFGDDEIQAWFNSL